VHEPQASNAGSASSIQHNFSIFNLATSEVKSVDEACEADDSSPMLVIVEDWDVAEFLEFLFDVEALGRLDVLQVDTTKSTRQKLDAVDELVGVLRVDRQINRFHASELVKES
jgi:hypothetical protein